MNFSNLLAIGLGTPELLVLGGIVLLFFGGAKIPQLMRGLGRGMGEFQEGVKDGKKKFDDAMKDLNSDDPAPSSKE